MFAFLRRRMYTSLIPLLVVLFGVFLLARLTGDPTNLYLPVSATPDQRAEFAAENGLDKPVWNQMLDYLGGVIHLDFGESLRTGESAAEWPCARSRPPCSSRSSPCCWPSSGQ